MKTRSLKSRNDAVAGMSREALEGCERLEKAWEVAWKEEEPFWAPHKRGAKV